ncbi:hypothetical protein [Rhizobium rhizosphaerae]|nr:hypothetical protein [Xaviernesmea rhizosphaerae]
MIDLSPDAQLADTLRQLAACLNQTGAPWMIFGGAAMVLHGLEPGPVKDIDVILSQETAAALAARHGWSNQADGTSALFRSAVLLRPDFGPIPVELLGGFQIRTQDGWTAVESGGSQPMRLGGETLHVAEARRLSALFRLCGRPKDIRRAAMLDARAERAD